MSNTPDLKSLIAQADELLAETDSDQAFLKLETYTGDFDLWFKAYQGSLAGGKPLNTKAEMESLLERHEKVVHLSQEMQDNHPDEMKKLKAKGKGIMAYTDTLPKKISFTKTRKG